MTMRGMRALSSEFRACGLPFAIPSSVCNIFYGMLEHSGTERNGTGTEVIDVQYGRGTGTEVIDAQYGRGRWTQWSKLGLPKHRGAGSRVP